MKRIALILLLVVSVFAIDQQTDNRIKALERQVGKIPVMFTEPNKANLVPGGMALYTTPTTYNHRLYIHYGDSVKYFDIDDVTSITAALALKQDDADTSTTDATTYWVTTTKIDSIGNTTGITGNGGSGTVTIGLDTTFAATQTDLTAAVLNKQDYADTSTTDATTYWTIREYNGKRYLRNYSSITTMLKDNTGTWSSGHMYLQADSTIALTSATYDLSLADGSRLEGTWGTLIDWNKITSDAGRHMFYLNGVNDVIIDGFKIDQNCCDSDDHESDDAFLFINCDNIVVRNLQIANASGNGGLDINGCKNVLVDNVLIEAPDNIPSVGSKAYTCITICAGSVFGPDHTKNVRIINSELIGGTHSCLDIETSSSRGYDIEDVFIDNCKMWKRDRNQAGLQIYGGNIKNVHVSNCTFFNCGFGSVLTLNDSTCMMKDIMFNNCVFDSCERGVEIRGVSNLTFDNCTVRRSLYDGIKALIHNPGAGTWRGVPTDNSFYNCKSVKNGYCGFYMLGTVNTTFVGCQADSNTLDGYSFGWNAGYDPDFSILSGCSASYNTSDGIYVAGANKFTVTGGEFNNNGGYGIWADSARTAGLFFDGNHAWSNTAADYAVHASITDYQWGINTGSQSRVLNTDMKGNSIVGLRDIWHDEASTGRDFYIYNADENRDTYLGINNDGTPTDIMYLSGSNADVNIMTKLRVDTLTTWDDSLQINFYGNSISGLRDIWHDEATGRDFYIVNMDTAKKIIFRVTQPDGSSLDMVDFDGNSGYINMHKPVASSVADGTAPFSITSTTVNTNLNADMVDGVHAASWVVGPASATDHAIARYDLTTGKLIQNSSAILDDSGQLGLGTASPACYLTIKPALPIGMMVTKEATPALTDSSIGLGVYAGNGQVSFRSAGGDTSRILAHADTMKFEGAANYEFDGLISAPGKLTMRPAIVAGRIGGISKPTPVAIGAHAGYSMPVYAADDEEVFFREYVPGRWDGKSDIVCTAIVATAGAEDIGDSFSYQLSWENTRNNSGVLTTGTVNDTVTVTVTTGHTAQYSLFKLEFTINWDLPTLDVTSGDHLGCRLRRIDAPNPDIAGEVILLDLLLTYTVDKVYKQS